MLKQINNDVIINIKLRPNAKQNSIDEIWNDYLKVSVKSPPEGGKANAELIKFLSKIFYKNKSEVQIISGKTSHQKTIKIENIVIKEIEKIIVLKLK